jgi:stage V sporulation protein G
MSETNDIKFSVRVFPTQSSKGSLRAFASVSIEDFAAIRGLRVNEGERGLFVSMPRSKGGDGKYHDIAYPTTGELRKEINKAVLDEYRRETNSRAREAPEAAQRENTARSVAPPVDYSVKVYMTDEPKSNTRAFASVNLGDIMAIRSLRVVEGRNGLFVTMPQTKGKDDKYYDVAFPTTGELRKEITAAVLGEYEKQAVKDVEREDAGTEKPGIAAKLDAVKETIAKENTAPKDIPKNNREQAM